MKAMDLFEHARRYPNAPGYQDTDTSREAAEAVEPAAKTIAALALVAIERAGATGLTAEELAETLRLDRVIVQPRTTELKLLGKVRDSGQRRHNASSGKRAIVWVLVASH